MKIELQNVNTNKLHEELIKAGVIPDLVESKDDTTWVTIGEDRYDSVMAVAVAHDPTPLPPIKSPYELLLEENIKLKNGLFEQNQTMSDLMDILFTYVPELSEL